jgi:hypothetical protein
MSLANQCDTRDRLSAGRSRSSHSFRPAGRADRAKASATGQEITRADRLSFAEDFLLEHTNSGLHIAVIGRASAAKTGLREQQKSAQCFGFPS